MYTIDELQKKCPLLEYCLVNAVTKVKKSVMDKIMSNKNFLDVRMFDIKLVVNDVELPLMETFKSIEKQMDRMIREKATELLNGRLNEFDEKLDEAYQDFEDKMIEIILEEKMTKKNLFKLTNHGKAQS